MHISPVKGVTLPKEQERRARRPSVQEIEKIMHVAGYVSNFPCKTNTSQVCAAFLFAIETGMRAGEIMTQGRSPAYPPDPGRIRDSAPVPTPRQSALPPLAAAG